MSDSYTYQDGYKAGQQDFRNQGPGAPKIPPARRYTHFSRDGMEMVQAGYLDGWYDEWRNVNMGAFA